MQRTARGSSNQQLLALLASLLLIGSGACATGSNGDVVLRDAADVERRAARANDITRDEIAQLEPVLEDVGDLLRQIPSVRVRDHGSFICVEFGRATTQRGAGITQCPRQVAVVVDGALMAGPETFLPSLRPQAVERIEFLQPSAATTRYGTSGGYGALLIFTRSPGR